MMELLLLSGADSQDLEVMDFAVKARSMEATIMLLNWERIGKGEGELSVVRSANEMKLTYR